MLAAYNKFSEAMLFMYLIEKIKVNMDLWKEPNKLQSILKH